MISKILKSGYLLTKTAAAIISASIQESPKLPKVTHIQGLSCKILLFGYMGLGDALMFQPSLKAILGAFPLAEIDLLVGKESQSRAIFERLIEMEGCRFSRIFEADYKSLSISQLGRLNKELTLQKYDIVICTYMSPSPYFTKAIMSSSIRVGHSLPWDKWYKPRANRIFNVSVRLAQDHEHETSRHLRLISKLLESKAEYFRPYLKLSKSEIEYAQRFWNQDDLNDRIVIGTHFGASKAQRWKKWDDDRYSEVLKGLSAMYNPIFLHFGVASEQDQIENASKYVQASSINLAGKLSIFEVAAMLQKCNVMLANDSGLGHIAMAVGTPTLRVFGMSDYWGYRSLSSDNVDVFKGISCSPCLQLGYLKPYNVHNCGHKNCMKLITSDEVLNSFNSIDLVTQNLST